MEDATGYGAPWYEPEDYEEMRLLLKDSANMPESYLDWLVRFEKSAKAAKLIGRPLIKIQVKPAKFAVWCHLKGRACNTEALCDFLSAEALRISNAGG